MNVWGFLIFLFALHLSFYPRYSENLVVSIARILAISGLILSAYYIAVVVVATQEHGLIAIFAERFVGGVAALPWGATNSIASCLLIAYIAAFLCTLDSRYRKIGSLSLLLIATAILVTVSRNAVIVLILISLMWGVVLGRPRIVAMVLALSGVFLWALDAHDTDVLTFLYETRLDEGKLSTLNTRTEIWEERFEYFLRNPLNPVGYYGSLSAFDGVSAHNALLTALLEQTALGLLLFLGMFGLGLFHLLRRIHSAPATNKQFRLALSVGLTGIFLNLQFEDANFTQPYIIYFWLLMALVFLSSGEPRKYTEYR
jgi:O-antigen ligase